jgi:hypothetical protein
MEVTPLESMRPLSAGIAGEVSSALSAGRQVERVWTKFSCDSRALVDGRTRTKEEWDSKYLKILSDRNYSVDSVFAIC